MTVLRELLLDSRDGEWGKGEPFDGGHWSSVIRGTDFAGARIGEVSNVPNRVLEDRHLRRKVLAPQDIIIETAGGTKDQPTGRTLYVTERLLNALPHPAVCASFARFLRIDPAKAHPGYIYWLLQDHYQRRELLRFHTQHTGVARFQFTTFADTYEFQLPRPKVQRSVADMLFAYDDLIEVNQRRIAILEDMARRLFDEWFVRFRYPGHEAVPLVETELGMVPEGWQIETARQALTYTGGGTPSKAEPRYWHDGDIQWFTPTDLTKSGQTFLRRSSLMITKEGLAKSSARLFPALSIMMTSRATLGVFAINTEPATTNQGFITFIPCSRTPVYFLFHMLKREFPRMEAVASGATFKEITKGALGELVFAFPTERLAHRFEQVVTPMMEQVAIISRQNDGLRAARDLLLPKLISGEIDVSAAEETFAEAAE